MLFLMVLQKVQSTCIYHRPDLHVHVGLADSILEPKKEKTDLDVDSCQDF